MREIEVGFRFLINDLPDAEIEELALDMMEAIVVKTLSVDPTFGLMTWRELSKGGEEA